MTIDHWITRNAGITPEKVAVCAPDGTLSYAQLDARIRSAAHYLTAPAEKGGLGLKHGDRLGYLGLNSAAQIVLLFAAARTGLMLVPLNWRLAADELRFIIADCEAALLFSDRTFLDLGAEVVRGNGQCRLVSISPGGDNPGFWDHLKKSRTSGLPGGGKMGDNVLLVYTSGTTGHPKGAVHTQASLEANARQSIDMHGMVRDDHVLTVLPMFHVGGLNIQTTPALYCGARVTLHGRFDPASALGDVERLRPTLTVHVPATFQALIATPEWANVDLSSLRAIATGSTDVPVPIIQAVHAKGVPVIQVYGATETGPVVVYQQVEDAHSHIGSIGRAGIESEVRIVATDGKDLPDGETGEIWVKAPNVAARYWKNAEADAGGLRDGWFMSGDMARRDADGYLWFADRIKNVIISGGENIYPAEIERLLRDIPGIAECCVVARNDTRWGSVPVAVIVADEAMQERSTIDIAGISAALDGRLARYKHPRDLVVVEALPRNAMGKIEIEAIRKLVQA